MACNPDKPVPGSPRHLPAVLACLLLALEPALSFVGPVAGVAVFGGWNPRAMYVTAVIVNALAVSFICAAFLRKLGPAVRPTAPDLFAGVMCTVCAYPAALLVSELVNRIFPDGGAVEEAVSGSTAFGPALAWILMAALPAVSEELLFRGVLFGSFRKYGFPFALAASSAGFALIHGSVRQMSYTLLMGLAWGVLRELSGSVFPGMLGHMAFNSVALLAAFQPSAAGGQPAAPGLLPLAAVSVLGAAGCAAILSAMKRRAGELPARDPFWKPIPALAAAAMAVNLGLSYLISTI